VRTDYSYQGQAAKIVLTNALSGKYTASILGATPGSGKTTISQIILNSYTKMFPAARILVLTEGKNVLKNQYLDELNSSHVKINFTYGGFESNAQVRVGLPQSINRLEWDKVDLLLVDECHHFFMAPMVQSIVKKLNPTHKILMTGSPTQFNGNRKYAIHYISAEELFDKGVFSGVQMDVVRTQNKNNAKAAINDALLMAKKNNDNASKIMVACPSIEYANQVAFYLDDKGYKVALSTSENDQDDVQIKNFKDGKANALVVVGKGILGFNDSNITLLVDMKSSDNLDSSYQIFARTLRRHPDNVTKAYYRVADTDFNKQVVILHKMLGLTKREIFKDFNGKNMTVEIMG
jgi:superfamily II DNA or RNA helicase